MKETVAWDQVPLSIHPKIDGTKDREYDSWIEGSEFTTFQEKSAPIKISIGKFDRESSRSTCFSRLFFAKCETSVDVSRCGAHLLRLLNALMLTLDLSQMLNN
ncbi:hypothetical protein NPIL_116491 [Nephila pilipes]|uniref:Uncharacterized protein n=1 Tax=Nephila pilipes TaxID=299642 RepID=A0A8X6PHX8_NEPPI|nr:hypothetical protein NPIL_116491 [Nephila pilipes]